MAAQGSGSLPVIPVIEDGQVHYYEADARGTVTQWGQWRTPAGFTVQDAVTLGLTLHQAFDSITARNAPTHAAAPVPVGPAVMTLGPAPSSAEVLEVLRAVGPSTVVQLAATTGVPKTILSMRLGVLRKNRTARCVGRVWHANGVHGHNGAPRGTAGSATAKAKGIDSMSVLAFITEHNGVTRTQLMAMLNLDRKTLYNRLYYLRESVRLDGDDRLWV
jgi:hypothetical protein